MTSREVIDRLIGVLAITFVTKLISAMDVNSSMKYHLVDANRIVQILYSLLSIY